MFQAPERRTLKGHDMAELPDDSDARKTERMAAPRSTDRMPEQRATNRMPEQRATNRMPEQRATNRMPEQRATNRMPEQRATGRMAEKRATDRLEMDTSVARLTQLHLGETIEDRYQIAEGPLGEPTGEAEIFRCDDLHTNEQVVLKFYRKDYKPKTSVLERLHQLNHPDIVSLRAYGEYAGHFYEVMEYCSGGCVSDFSPYGENALRSLVPEMVSGLKYLHDQDIIHRDIKPNNFFYRVTESGERDLVLGDFGISSVLEKGEKVRKTSTGEFLTIDYSAPEVINSSTVSSASDYYSLGITLLHLLSGKSPFAGMNKNETMSCHIRGQVPRPEGLSEEFEALIEGLLRFDTASRWEYDQVAAWLRGDTVIGKNGEIDRRDLHGHKEFPYRSYKTAKTPLQLAKCLHLFDSEQDLKRGYFSNWALYFDDTLGEQVAAIEEEYSDNAMLGVFKLRYLFDPRLPLRIGDREVRNLVGMADLLAMPGYPKDLEDALYDGRLEAWLDAAQVSPHTPALLSAIEGIQKRCRARALGAFALLYVLEPRRPLYLGPDANLASLESLEELIEARPAALAAAQAALFDGRLAEWIRAAFPDRQDDASTIARLADEFRNNQELGMYALRWHLCPSLPFQFGDDLAAAPSDLARMIDRDAAATQRGARLLQSGWIRTWLYYTGYLRQPAELDRLLANAELSIGRKLEDVLRIMDPALAAPRMECSQPAIGLGTVTTEGTESMRVRIFNVGRGHLAGSVTLDDQSGVFTLDGPTVLDGAPIEVRVSANGLGQAMGATFHAQLRIATNGGNAEIPVSVKIAAPIARMVLRSIGVGAGVGAVLGAFRFAMQTFLPAYTNRVLDWVPLDYVTSHPEQWGFLLLGGGLAAIIGGGLYYLYRMSPGA
jgi:hypothetical protein